MNDKLTALFEAAEPGELDLLLAGISLPEDPGRAAVRDRVRKRMPRRARPNRRPLWIAAAAAVIVLAAVTGLVWPKSPNLPDDPTAVNPGVTETADPEPTDPQPTESVYDVFSDPNVLWGEKENVEELGNYLPPGCIMIAPGLQKLIGTATEKNLIAFTVYPLDYCAAESVDIERLYIPEELKDDPTLLELLEAFNADGTGYGEIRRYVSERVSEEESLAFYAGWQYLEAELYREWYIEKGFIPVYGEEHQELSKYPDFYETLTFVGTADAILRLAEPPYEKLNLESMLLSAGDDMSEIDVVD